MHSLRLFTHGCLIGEFVSTFCTIFACYSCSKVASWLFFIFFLMTLIWKMTFDLRLVNKINNSIGQDPNSKCLIGVLDIYGFESFKTNRFLIATL